MLSGDDVGNGGNPALLSQFDSARTKVVAWMGEGLPRSYRPVLEISAEPEEREWIERYWFSISQAAKAAEFKLAVKPQAKCGSTQVGDLFAPIFLDERQCLLRAPTFNQMAEVILHECVHHVGIESEALTERYTYLIARLFPENLQGRPGTGNREREADLVCVHNPPVQGSRRLLADKIGEEWRVKSYRWSDGEWLFQFRVWCPQAESGVWICDEGITLTDQVPRGSMVAYVEESGVPESMLWCNGPSEPY